MGESTPPGEVRPTGSPLVGHDRPLDTPRYVAALRRGSWLMLLIVVPLTATVLVLSLLLPKTYTATASLVLDEQQGVLDTGSGETSVRRLATTQRLLTSRDVLERAAAQLPGETADTLEDKVKVTSDDAADIIHVQGSDGDAEGAAAIANGVARTFLAGERAADERSDAAARRDLEELLRRLEGSGASAAEIRAVRDRLAELSVSRIGGDELRLAQAARPPESAAAPRPLQSTIFALFASIFIAVLVALGRDLVSPRLAGPRQLTALTGLSPLVVMPSGQRRGRAARADEAYQALAASVRLQLSESQRVVVVTSPHVDAGRAEVSVGLGRALSSSGVPTLLASADLRHPMIHEKIGVPQAPGLGEVLSKLEADPGESAGGLIRTATRSHQRPSPGELRALPSGDISHHPAALLSGESLGVVFDELGHSEYRYVIVEGPPLLGPIDGQLVARWADAVLVVCRLDRLSPDDAVELGEVLARLRAPVLGSVVVGGSRVRYSLPAWTPVRAKA
jgi:polysaccharide biosynthesis transport protein